MLHMRPSRLTMDLAKGLRNKQREISRFRQMMAYVVESADFASVALAPPRRQARKGR